MKNYFLLAALFTSMATLVSAEDGRGRLGIHYSLGPNFVVGGSGARDAGSVQPGVGAALQYGLLPNVDFLFAYDYLHADLHSQAITFGGQYRVDTWTRGAWTPLVGAGLGFGKPYAGEGWDHFSLKLNGGAVRSLTPTVSMAATLGYQYIDGSKPIGSVHVFEPAVRMIFYFR